MTPIVAMLAGDASFFQAAKAPLEELLGPVEMESPLYPFDKTIYYAESMGPGLLRQFFAFRDLKDPALLAGWKLATNAMEANLGRILSTPGGPPRPINLDVGYITGAKLVLASTKDFAHRLYLRDGIFAEITMGFRDNAWISHAFTFPDFKSGIYDAFLKRVRDEHLGKRKHARREQLQHEDTKTQRHEEEGE
ncbi:MAG TPA: DUF4416 family protein [Planctomycetota bacterium]|nr:DUF4416 family protein [Planctomycetota bacterium]